MPINILMPALSPTMEKGNLAKWLKKEGDKVKAGDILAEIETDKATMEYEAIDEGMIAKMLVPEGTADIAVNQPIAVLAAEGEDVKAAASAAPAAAPAGHCEVPAGAPPAAAAATPAPAPAASNPAAGCAAPRVARAHLRHLLPHRQNGHAGRVFASPLARRLAKTAGIDVGRIAGAARTAASSRAMWRRQNRAASRCARRHPPRPASHLPVQAPSDDKIRALVRAWLLRGRAPRQYPQASSRSAWC